MMLQLDAREPKASVLWHVPAKAARRRRAARAHGAAGRIATSTRLRRQQRRRAALPEASTGEVVWETYAATSGEEFANWSTAFIVPNPTPDTACCSTSTAT